MSAWHWLSGYKTENNIEHGSILILFFHSEEPFNALVQLSGSEVVKGRESLKIDVSKTPLYQKQYEGENLKSRIEAYLSKNSDLDAVQFSVKINNRWLNLSAAKKHWEYGHVVWLLSIVMIVFFTVIAFIWLVGAYTLATKQIDLAIRSIHKDIYSRGIILPRLPFMRQVSISLMHMRAYFKSLLKKRSYMIGIVSHDLKQPLARMRLALRDVDHRVYVENAHNDIDDALFMIDGLLKYIRDDAYREKKSKIEFVSLLYLITDQYIDAGRNVTITSDVYQAHLMAASSSIKRCIKNIIDNALKYAGDAEISLTLDSQDLLMKVRDHGSGVAEQEIPNLLKPFYRSLRDRDSDRQGSGLGLAMVDDVVAYHKGQLVIQNHPEGGFEVIIRFPLMRDSEESGLS